MNFLYISNFFTYFLSSFQLFDLGGYSFAYNNLILVFFFFYALIRIFWNGESIIIPLNEVTYSLLALFITIWISAYNPISQGNPEYLTQYFKTNAHLYFIMVFALFNLVFKIDEKVWINAIRTYLICMLIINIFGIYQLFARLYDWEFAWIDVTNVASNIRGKETESVTNQLALKFENFYRATSIFSEPSILAQYNLISIVFIFVPMLNGTKKFIESKIFNVLFIVFSLVALLFAFSLNGFFGLGLLGVCAYIFQKKIKIKPVNFIVSVIAIAILFIIADKIVYELTSVSIFDLTYSRVSSIFGGKANSIDVINGESYFDRANNGLNGIKAWLAHPYFGTGLGLTYTTKASDMPFLEFTTITLLLETGLFGFLAYVSFMFILTYKSFTLKNKLEMNPQNEMETNFATIMFYIMIIEIYVNFFTAGWFVNESSWHYIALLFWLVAKESRDYGLNSIQIQILKRPLKKIFIIK